MLNTMYGGTKTEMERLISDASKMTAEQKKLGLTVKAGDTSFANIANAISVVQEKLGIAGTTNKEASTTIQGSLHMVQSAWGNLLTAFVVGGDSLDQCIDNMVDSVKTFAKNLVPAIKRGLEGLGKAIPELAPVIAKELPSLIQDIVPPLIKSATVIVAELVKALPTILPPLFEGIVKAIYEGFTGKTAAAGMFDGFRESLEKLKPVIKGVIPVIAALFAAFKGYKAISSISSLFGGGKKGGESKGIFSGIKDTFKELAKTDTKTILKGMANLAIIIGGFAAITAALMFVAPYVAQLSDTGSILKMVGIMAVVGLVGTALAKFGEIAGKIPVATVAKGLANMAIMIGGMSALFLLVGAVSLIKFDLNRVLKISLIIGVLGVVGLALSAFAAIAGLIPIPIVLLGLANMALVIAGMSALFLLIGAVSLLKFDYKRMLQIVGIIGVLGAVGSALTLFAGIVGLIPIPVVLAGLANIGLVIGGMTALIVAFGKLSEIKGFNEFITTGGATLANLFNQVGKIAGSLVGGLGEGLTASLPVIGKNLADFAEAIRPMFSVFEGADMKGIGSFFKSFGSFMLDMAGEGLASILTGGVNFGELGTGLSTFAEKSAGFFTKVATFPTNGFTNAKLLFESLADIGNIPNTGGMAQWFSGTNDYDDLAKGLGKLSSEKVVKFFTTYGAMSPETFTNAKNLFVALEKIGDLPKMKGLGGKGGNIDKLGESLKTFTENSKPFFEQVNNINLEKLNGLWNSLKKPSEITGNVLSAVTSDIDSIVKKVTELPNKMAKGIKSSGESLASALASVWKDAVKASIAPVNKVIDGANWILKEFSSKKRVEQWKPYANGTNGHTGGNALVNDGRGAELVQMPNGQLFLPNGRNVFIPNAPKGMRVLSAEKTAALMGKNSPTFKYANGTGDIDVFSYSDNPKGLISAMTKKFVNYDGMKGYVLSAGKAMVSTITGEMTGWVKSLFEESGGMSIANYVASKGVEQWRSTVIRALKMEGQYSEANVQRMLMQMQTESSGNPRCINLWDINAKRGIPSKGLMQCIDPTFKQYARKGYDKDIYDPLSNCLASIRYTLARYGSLANGWHGHGYANGGIATTPSIFGESGAEIAIPLTQNKRKRALDLWYTAGSMLGVTSRSPESGSTSVSKAATTENNTYAPVFNLTISGSGDDRAMERKVKAWISEAMDDVFDGMARKNPRMVEV